MRRDHRHVLVTALGVAVRVAVVLLTLGPGRDIRDRMGITLPRMRIGDEA